MALEDRTEAPTPRRRQEAREEGQVARSVELNSALILLCALVIVRFCGSWSTEKLRNLMVECLTYFPDHDITLGDVTHNLARVLLEVGAVTAPLVVGVAVVGFVSCALQVGLTISGKPLQLRGERLNPISGIARMFSIRAGMECIKAIGKVLVVGYIVYSFIRTRQADIALLAGSDYKVACKTLGWLVWELLIRAAIAILVIAVIDYMFQRFQHEKQLRMTKQEVKEDLKRTEGDPLVKSRIRQRQREITRRYMMREVPKADVVVTNPTHYAVALKYDPEVHNAPVVVAKGIRLLALKIREIAEQNHVPIVEDPQLARTIYATVEVGEEIPAELYQAVAEIMAYVYRLSRKVAGA